MTLRNLEHEEDYHVYFFGIILVLDPYHTNTWIPSIFYSYFMSSYDRLMRNCARITKNGIILCYNSSRNELLLVKKCLWTMWEHTFPNHNSPHDELWYNVVPFSMVPVFSIDESYLQRIGLERQNQLLVLLHVLRVWKEIFFVSISILFQFEVYTFSH